MASKFLEFEEAFVSDSKVGRKDQAVEQEPDALILSHQFGQHQAPQHEDRSEALHPQILQGCRIRRLVNRWHGVFSSSS